MSDQVMMNFAWVSDLMQKMKATETQLNEHFGDWRAVAAEAVAVWPDGVGALFEETDQVLRQASESLTQALGNLTQAVGNAQQIMGDGYNAAKQLFG